MQFGNLMNRRFVKPPRGNPMEEDQPKKYDRRKDDKKLAEIEKNLQAFELKMGTWNVRVSTLFAAGVFFWGITSWFINNKLSQIEKTIETVQDLQSKYRLIEYQLDQQLRTNGTIISQLERNRDIYENLQMRLTRLEADLRTE